MKERSSPGTGHRARTVNPLLISLLSASVAVTGVIGQEKVPASNPPATRPNSSSRPTGSIDGQVTDDSGKPAADVMVSIGRFGEDRAPATVLTDPDGRFQIKSLAPGVYHVGARSPGFITSNDSAFGPDGLLKFYRPGESASISLVKGGVITGTVTDQSGNPVVGVNVTVVLLAGSDDFGGALGVDFGNSRSTDDRGIYRIYGLRGGRYLVYAGSGRSFPFRTTPFDRDAPTYYPSSTRDTASILSVQAGQELTGIDIRYRGDPGYSITGTVSGNSLKFVQFALIVPGNVTPVSSSFSQEQDGRMSFSISNLTSGDYKIVGYGRDDKAKQSLTGTVAVSVRNADVSGVVMRLFPLASINGRYVMTDQPNAKCETKASPGLEQILVVSQAEKKLTENPFVSYQDQASVANNGEFQINDLANGNYRLRTSLPSDDWFISSITRKSLRAPENQIAKASGTPAELITMANGESISNLVINLSNGGGVLSGQIGTGLKTATFAVPTRIYLIPSEKERADDTLRFSNVLIGPDGSFSFRNLAPGRYFLLSRVENDPIESFRPLEWDPKERAALLRAGAASGFAVEIKPCQQIADLQLVAGPDGSVKLK